MAYRYKKINLGNRSLRDRHRLIMEDFIGRRLGRDEVVHHKNGDPSDDSIENLQVISRSDHAKLHMKGVRPPYTTKLTEDQVREIKHSIETEKYDRRKLASKYGVSPWAISKIKCGVCWKHVA